MPVQRKVFRIEMMQPVGAAHGSGATALSKQQMQEILNELQGLRSLIERRTPAPAPGRNETPATDDLRALRHETDAIYLAITRTRQEIARVQAGAFDVTGGAPVTRELDAVVDDVGRATQQILDAAEEIDQAASMLSATLAQERERSLAQDIQDQVIRIFEACNFHDLSGQRINKVMSALAFIEDHVHRMREIWTGIGPFEEAATPKTPATSRARGFIHGPKIEGEAGHASQEDIDLLFLAG